MSTFMLWFTIIGACAGLVYLLAGIFDWKFFFSSGHPYRLKKIFGDMGGRIFVSVLGGFVFFGLSYVLIMNMTR